MNPDYRYAKTQLSLAVDILATGAGDVRSRLLDAYLQFHAVREDDFPEELKSDWQCIIFKLTKYEPITDCNGKIIYGSVENTMRNIKNKTGVKIAKEICDLECKMSAYVEELHCPHYLTS